MDGCVQLQPAGSCYLYTSERREERSETTLALALELLLFGGEERKKKVLEA